ncbi:hypothetical protein QBC37DRAFT_464966 [Rhypophila decipiens]|uniref:Uncharacterized protein n=1 Tax=Rhypophila decipiens TaxID=261697 RepID=A0AAN6Y573_9PEZI|nr:hypothetical protein QBC37DRAFT_464966 [Rhypophila decipiens]
MSRSQTRRVQKRKKTAKVLFLAKTRPMRTDPRVASDGACGGRSNWITDIAIPHELENGQMTQWTSVDTVPSIINFGAQIGRSQEVSGTPALHATDSSPRRAAVHVPFSTRSVPLPPTLAKSTKTKVIGTMIGSERLPTSPSPSHLEPLAAICEGLGIPRLLRYTCVELDARKVPTTPIHRLKCRGDAKRRAAPYYNPSTPYTVYIHQEGGSNFPL